MLPGSKEVPKIPSSLQVRYLCWVKTATCVDISEHLLEAFNIGKYEFWNFLSEAKQVFFFCWLVYLFFL